MRPILNKKGDIPSLIYAVVILFAIGFIFIFMNTLNHKLFTTTEGIFNSSSQLNNSQAIPTLQKIRATDDVAWDWAFLALYIGMMIALGMTAYATRISMAFYWIYIISSLFVLALGVAMSNGWQTAVSTGALQEAATRFPITNILLGSYAPIAVTALILITAILLFGKTPEGNQ